MAKHVLHSSYEDLDFVLIGLRSSEDQYSLVSLVNRALGIDLALSDQIPYNLKDGKIFNFSLYRYLNEELGLEYFLIPNASNFEPPNASRIAENETADLFGGVEVEESTRLIKELPKTDYFILLKGEELHMYQFKIMDLLKTVKEIVQVQSIEARDLPSRMNLVF